MFLKSINLELYHRNIITDIDNCLIKSKESISLNGFNSREFYFNEKVYNKNKEIVFGNAELTAWGEELKNLIEINKLGKSKVILISAAPNRDEIILKIFKVGKENIYSSKNLRDKLNFLNSVLQKSIYVDDSNNVANRLRNNLIECVNYPKKKIIIIKGNRKFRR